MPGLLANCEPNERWGYAHCVYAYVPLTALAATSRAHLLPPLHHPLLPPSFLLFYYVGVSKVLQQIGVIKPGHTKTAASSAGERGPSRRARAQPAVRARRRAIPWPPGSLRTPPPPSPSRSHPQSCNPLCPARPRPHPYAGILSAAIDHGFATHDQFLATGKAFAARCRAKHNCAGVLSEEVQKTAEQLAPSDAAARLSGVGYIALSSPNVLGVPVGHYVVNYTSREGETGFRVCRLMRAWALA